MKIEQICSELLLKADNTYQIALVNAKHKETFVKLGETFCANKIFVVFTNEAKEPHDVFRAAGLDASALHIVDALDYNSQINYLKTRLRCHGPVGRGSKYEILCYTSR